ADRRRARRRGRRPRRVDRARGDPGPVRPDRRHVPRPNRRRRAGRHPARGARPHDGRRAGGGMSPVPPVIDAGRPSRLNAVLQRVLDGNWLVGIVAVLLSILVGSVLIAVTDAGVQEAAGYFFARPLDTLAAIWESI